MNRSLSTSLVLSVDAAHCSPCGIGAAGSLSATLQHGISSAAGLACVGALGGGGSVAVLSAPLRICGGGSATSSARSSLGGGGDCSAFSAVCRIADGGRATTSTQLSIDGPRYTAALSQAMPMSLMSGSGAVSAPLSLSNPATLSAPYDVVITADGCDITGQVSECVIVSSESALFDTLNLTLPDGSAWPLDNPPAVITVSLPDAIHAFMVEEFGGDGASRTIWGRPPAARLAEPWSSSSVWNQTTVDAATASALAAHIGAAVWAAADFPLPPRWEIDGTPAEALKKIAAAAGGVAVAASDPDGIVIRRRWPVRPLDMSSSTLTINRENALELSIDPDSTPSYGSVIVHGFSPDALLPKFSIEGSPQLGQPAYLRLYWQGADCPLSSDWITSGSAVRLERVTEELTETVVFSDGAASVAWPIWDLLSFTWLGNDYGDISWLENGYSTDVSLSSPGHGVALVTYRSAYDRWLLSGQAVETVLFGVDVSQSAYAANIQLSSGGPAAGETTEALLGSVPACVVHGTALLDDSRVRHTIKASLPRLGHIVSGETAWVEDELSGISGFGKIVSISTTITPSRITQELEVALC